MQNRISGLKISGGVTSDLGSVTNVMEEPAVELPLLAGHGIVVLLAHLPALVVGMGRQATSSKLQAPSVKLDKRI